MNRSKIEWCDHTWNPITGCLHECAYCYARMMAKRFSGDVRLNKMAKNDYVKLVSAAGEELYILEKAMMNENGSPIVYPFGFEPTLHRYRFDTLDKLKMGNNIFVGAMADVFGDWVPDEWIEEVILECIKRPQHNYLFLTKNPSRYITFGVPTQNQNMWYGTTITGPSDMKRMGALIIDGKTFVSIEPLQARLAKEDVRLICNLSEWIIIGAETGRRSKKVLPEFAWIKDIVLEADNAGVPVFMKDSLIEIVGAENMRREFPEALKRKTVSDKLQDKLINKCCMCGTKQRKNEMITLIAKSVRNENKRIGYICKPCFLSFCEEHQLENDLQVFKNKEE